MKSWISLMLVTLVVIVLLITGSSAFAATGSVADLSAYCPTNQPFLATGVVSSQPTEFAFSRDVRVAMSQYQVVYAFAAPESLARAAGDIGISADVPNAQASAIIRPANGRYSMVALVSNAVLDEQQRVDALTRLVNNARTSRQVSNLACKGAYSISSDGVPGSPQPNLSLVSWFGWGAYTTYGGQWAGDVRQYSYCSIRLNDGDSTYDYWTNETIQQTDPGTNGHGGYFETYYLQSKFYLATNGYTIQSAQPGSTVPPSVVNVSFVAGWPSASAGLSVSFQKPSINMVNQTSPSSYAMWTETWSRGTAASLYYSELHPTYSSIRYNNTSFRGQVLPRPKWIGVSWGPYPNVILDPNPGQYTFTIAHP